MTFWLNLIFVCIFAYFHICIFPYLQGQLKSQASSLKQVEPSITMNWTHICVWIDSNTGDYGDGGFDGDEGDVAGGGDGGDGDDSVDRLQT